MKCSNRGSPTHASYVSCRACLDERQVPCHRTALLTRCLQHAGAPVTTMQRHSGSPGSDESISTSMLQPPLMAQPAAVDWTPKKIGAGGSLADSSASPVSVIPKNTRRRGGAPDLAQDARRRPIADGQQGAAGRGASMPHPSSRILGALQGGGAHMHPEGGECVNQDIAAQYEWLMSDNGAWSGVCGGFFGPLAFRPLVCGSQYCSQDHATSCGQQVNG